MSVHGFNRYMVECECGSIDMSKSYIKRFNRYMVECEFAQTMGADYYPATVLIDTWWNVNRGTVKKCMTVFTF